MQEKKYLDLLEVLHECMTDCNNCFDSCLQEDDVKMMTKCIRLTRECADICNYLEQAIARGTPFTTEIATVCAQICEACAKECKKHPHDHCQKCAESCTKCAQACREVA